MTPDEAVAIALGDIKARLLDYQSMLYEQSAGSEVFAHHATGIGIALRLIEEERNRRQGGADDPRR